MSERDRGQGRGRRPGALRRGDVSPGRVVAERLVLAGIAVAVVLLVARLFTDVAALADVQTFVFALAMFGWGALRSRTGARFDRRLGPAMMVAAALLAIGALGDLLT